MKPTSADRQDLDLGNQLAFDFATRYLAQHYDDVRDMFRRQGAYRRFKGFLERKDMLEKWYAYSDEQEAKALGEWCDTEGLSLGPCDYALFGTRVVCNPRGYPGENRRSEFRDDLVVSVG